MPSKPRILWADDEIELLRPHILFLETKGYEVTSVTNGADAIEQVRRNHFDVVLLDEHMPGMGGLETLAGIKALAPELPIVLVTKSEEEQLMEEALGRQISDYLTKPVNPSQILLTCKRLLEQPRIRNEKISQEYLQAFARIAAALQGQLAPDDWVSLYRQLTRFDVTLEGDEAARQILEDQFQEANRVFARYIEAVYPNWLSSAPGKDRPLLSHEVLPHVVFPLLEEGRPVLFLVIDCMRLDQWLEFERLLAPLFDLNVMHYFALLPTATPYARNALFSGLLPRDLARRYPDAWSEAEESENSRNRNEELFLSECLSRRRISARIRYEKLLGAADGRTFARQVNDFLQYTLSAVVVNFVDILAHSRSDSDVLKELAPDERAYRALTRTWFEHSWLYQAFQALAHQRCTILLTTDHGAIRCLHPTKVIGDRETSTALRFKFGRNLRCDERHALLIRDPLPFGLPRSSITTTYLLAKEDYYFVYPTNYHYYVNLYRDTFQHGGISLQEMIVPLAILRPKAV
ncbi:response regulator [Rhodothermus bifroesti]|mgnify:CR=1 FL=1|uniref:Response regulator n=1 Tax=Rhodothermus marinus TaxID=29549 RepID=A0A7V2B1Q7_RHOMR|nr:response regulator [Rhodothermus bifroesti]